MGVKHFIIRILSLALPTASPSAALKKQLEKKGAQKPE
jgi:hypothetical protein